MTPLPAEEFSPRRVFRFMAAATFLGTVWQLASGDALRLAGFLAGAAVAALSFELLRRSLGGMFQAAPPGRWTPWLFVLRLLLVSVLITVILKFLRVNTNSFALGLSISPLALFFEGLFLSFYART
jgi:hypothetical protein